MAEPDDWSEIALAVLRMMQLPVSRSPTLLSAIEMGVEWVRIDKKRKEVVFDVRALFLGLMNAGMGWEGHVRFGNAATWTVDWVAGRIGPSKLNEGLARVKRTNFSLVQDEFNRGGKLVLSISMRQLVRTAETIAQVTLKSPKYEARHLLAALIKQDDLKDQFLKIFKIGLTSEELLNFKTGLIGRILLTANGTETHQAWEHALDLPRSGTVDVPLPQATALSTQRNNFTPGAATEQSSFERLIYVTDSGQVADILSDRTPPLPPSGGPGENPPQPDPDVLRTADDARALARIMCLRNVSPLAIAVFGGWGSGKSSFMERLDAEVREIVKRQADDADTPPDEVKGPSFVGRVVQMRFNAWQFIDANLWTSLTAEFFDQLRAGGWDKLGEVSHAALVEKVNSHVHSLSADVTGTRAAAIDASRSLAEAQTARDTAMATAERAPGPTLQQSALDVLGEAVTAQKGNLSKLGLEAGADKSVELILDVARNSQSIWQQMRVLFRVIGASPARLRTARLALFVMVVLAWPLALWAGSQDPVRLGGAITAALAALGTFAAAVAPAVAFVKGVADRSAAIAATVEAADKQAAEAVLQSEIRLRAAAAEAGALQAAADRAAQRLSRYIDPLATTNKPRLLRYVLEDDPNTQALQKELGLIGRTRRLFQAVDEIVKKERNKPREEQADGEVPDRIVLYIDDLDRCTEDQVYAVLQAVHLLLAFDLFVVVVGVDIKWVQNALGKVLHDGGATTTSPKRRAEREREIVERSAQYLEKIFQLSIWLSPLDSAGRDGGSYGRYVRQLLGVPPEPDDPPPPSNGAGGQGEGSGGEDEGEALGQSQDDAPETPVAEASPAADRAPASAGEELDAIIVARDLQSLQLSQAEIDFLASPAISGVAAKTPRAIKRLVNVYRLVRSRYSVAEAEMADGPADVSLIALVVAIETGQKDEVARGLFNALQTLPPQDQWMPPSEGDIKTAISAADNARASNKPVPLAGGAPTLADVFAACPSLKPALEEVRRIRGGLTVGEAMAVCRIVRRYSFNPPY